MKKMILSITAILVVLFLAFGSYKASKLKHIHIQKRVDIKSDTQHVFDQVSYLENFKKWSPFLEADSTQKIKITGTDGQVGAKYHWEGNKGKDLGYQEIKEIKPLNYIKMQCVIEKPFKANPVFEYTFSESNGTVSVVQDFTLESGFVDAFFMWVFGAKKDIANMNARGMELLKNTCEK